MSRLDFVCEIGGVRGKLKKRGEDRGKSQVNELLRAGGKLDSVKRQLSQVCRRYAALVDGVTVSGMIGAAAGSSGAVCRI